MRNAPKIAKVRAAIASIKRSTAVPPDARAIPRCSKYRSTGSARLWVAPATHAYHSSAIRSLHAPVVCAARCRPPDRTHAAQGSRSARVSVPRSQVAAVRTAGGGRRGQPRTTIRLGAEVKADVARSETGSEAPPRVQRRGPTAAGRRGPALDASTKKLRCLTGQRSKKTRSVGPALAPRRNGTAATRGFTIVVILGPWASLWAAEGAFPGRTAGGRTMRPGRAAGRRHARPGAAETLARPRRRCVS